MLCFFINTRHTLSTLIASLAIGNDFQSKESKITMEKIASTILYVTAEKLHMERSLRLYNAVNFCDLPVP